MPLENAASLENAALELRNPEGPGYPELDFGLDPELEAKGYQQQEWTLRGVVDGHRYETLVIVRRPVDQDAFSGVVVTEPLHLFGAAVLWMLTGDYIPRSGHAWATIAAQKVTIEAVVAPSAPDRYSSLHIPGVGTASHDFMPPFEDREALAAYWDALDAHQPYSLDILAQGAAAIRRQATRLFGAPLTAMTLGGASENGLRTANFLASAYAELQPCLFDGYIPTAFPTARLSNPYAPIVQVLNEGDISDPEYAYRPGLEGRLYRRPDSDEPHDRYRLYELAGTSHGHFRRGTTVAQAASAPDTLMNSVPQIALKGAALDHLIRWITTGTPPPRAERLELDPKGLIAKDEHGNARGGVRSAEVDVPVATHFANAPDPRSERSNLLAGIDVPFPPGKLRTLYNDEATYVARYRARVDELVQEGWLLTPDAAQLASEAAFPTLSTVQHAS